MSSDADEARPIYWRPGKEGTVGSFRYLESDGIATAIDSVTLAEVVNLILNVIQAAGAEVIALDERVASAAEERATELSKDEAAREGRHYLTRGLAMLVNSCVRDNNLEAEVDKILEVLRSSEVLDSAWEVGSRLRSQLANAHLNGLKVVDEGPVSSPRLCEGS